MLLALALAAAPAHAVDGLAWTWDAPRRYLLEADVYYPSYQVFPAEENREVRIVATTLRVDTTCAPYGKPAKKFVEVRCSLDDIEIAALPLAADAGRVVTVLDEIERVLEPAYLQIEFNYDGRVRSIDLEGISTQNMNDRIRRMEQTIRLALVRAFAPFDLALPSGGADDGRPWTHDGMLANGFPSLVGSVGSVPVDIAVARTEGTLVTLSTKGQGVAGPGETVGTPGGGERIANTYAMTLSGFANFDTAAHALVARQYRVVGTPTASSLKAEGGSSAPYTQDTRLTLVRPTDPPPQLGPNTERTE